MTLLTGRDSNNCVADLDGFEQMAVPSSCFSQLQRGPGSIPGILLHDLPAESRDRICYLSEGLGFRATRQSVEVEGVRREATVYLPDGAVRDFGVAWEHTDWQEKWGKIALFAVEEVLGHFGTVPVQRLRLMMPMILVRAAARQAAAKGVPRSVRSEMPAEQVEVIEQHNRHAGFFLTREYTLRHPQFAGAMSPQVRREVFVATDAAIVLPFDPIRDRVLLVEQFRMGPYGRGDPFPWMLEPVAGRVDPGETPETTARRECVEEAGLSLRHLEHISSHYCSPGCSTEYFHCYLGLCDLPDIDNGQGGLDSEVEDICTHVLPFDHAVNMITTGEAANGPLILCLLWLQRERERLRADA